MATTTARQDEKDQSGGGAGVETPDPLARITKAVDDCELCIRKDWGAAAKDELQTIRNAVRELRALAQTKPAPEPVAVLFNVHEGLNGFPAVWQTRIDPSERSKPFKFTPHYLYASPVPPKGADPQIDVHLSQPSGKEKNRGSE